MYSGILASTLIGVALADPRCKNHPLNPNWPSIDDWNTLNRSTNGALIRTNPVESSCFNNNSAVNCDHVQENWFYSDLHSSLPESIGYPYWANRSCVPPNDYAYDKALGCELGGLPAQRNIRIVVKGTGHDLSGRSSGAHSLSIWTYHLRNLGFDTHWTHPLSNNTENAVILGSGSTWGEVLAAAAKTGRTVISGQDGTVGLGGSIGGGGHGPLSSHYGLSADHVLQATVVTTEGEILVANDAQNQDLLRAIRGGGPGLYGIMVEYVLRTVPLPNNVVMSTLSMSIIQNQTAAAAQGSWTAFGTFVSSVPDLMDAGITGYGFGVAQENMGIELAMTLWSYNTTAAAFKPLLESARQTMLADVASQTILVVVLEPTVLPTYLSLFDVLNPSRNRCGDISLTSSRLLGRRHLSDIPLDELRTHLQKISKAQVEGRQTRLVLGLQGGLGPRSVQNEMRGALSPAWRRAYLHLMATGVDINTRALLPQNALAAAAALAEGNKEAVWREWAPDTGAYINEANPFARNFQQDFYGGNCERLVQIKEKYDPTASLYALSGIGSHDWDYNLDSGLLCRV
ncbi:FAD-binding PCMH-type domain-containing protein [Fusarium falciforme]|uniref:FAD-binding PCMH-type domain-containing protein n=1 Tax=Fusarium falciforme TaxID=195108 RepID=UPI002301A038|nr:FAD-binding PCMH-type domain-containing protein [Fusarium falciforme]WAO86056.1 FAD-binding PCMH-type domain-containing protein [Fusarium falciforme]